MKNLLVGLTIALMGTAGPLPSLAQDAMALAAGPVVIAPPQTGIAQTIKTNLSAAYTTATRDTAVYDEAQKLYFLYGARHFEPIWLTIADNGAAQFSPAAQKIVALFEASAAEGFNPADYLTPELDLTQVGTDPNRLAALETAFSASTLRYATHLYTGRLDPRRVHETLDIVPKQLDGAALLTQLAGSDDPATVLAALEPTHPEFLALKAALANYEATTADRPQQIAAGATLRPGETDARVPVLRARLELPANSSTLYDDALVQAVKSFQQSLGLEVDGIIGPSTLARLNGGLPVTREDILANMERWRWMPRDLGAFHVLVNIPEFRLDINRNNVSEYSTRIVVGKPANMTPVFSDSIRHIVVNPYWNVPSSIVRGEIAPAVLRDPGYIDSHNYDLLYEGDAVSPWQVNWSMVTPDYFPFRVRQRPGPSNALGQIKFLFPNKHDVYLHDTPSKSLFARDVRAFSHGCVRVENPLEFAGALMANEPSISRTSLEAMFGPDERWVNPQTQIPVHLAYFTVRVDADGTLRNLGDVYGHNALTIEALGLMQSSAAPTIIAEAGDGAVAP
jgi:murein L,D-transpeptidase YcbB/YkuD